MSRAVKNRGHGSLRPSLLAGVAAVGLLAAAAAAQFALDANISISGPINTPTTPRVSMSRDPYVINRNSGEFELKRSSAFGDSTYDLYDRYRRGPIDSTPRVSTGSRVISGGARTSAQRRSTAGLSTPPGLAPVNTGRRSSSMSMPTYGGASRSRSSGAGSTRQSSMAMPTYRIAPTRLR